MPSVVYKKSEYELGSISLIIFSPYEIVKIDINQYTLVYEYLQSIYIIATGKAEDDCV